MRKGILVLLVLVGMGMANVASAKYHSDGVPQYIRDVVYLFFKVNNNFGYSCTWDSLNGRTVEDCGSFVVKYSYPFSKSDFIVEAPFSEAVSNQVSKIMQKHGYNVSSKLNINTPFVWYIVNAIDIDSGYLSARNRKHWQNLTSEKKVLLVTAGLVHIVNTGHIITFEQLVNSFVRYKILRR